MKALIEYIWDIVFLICHPSFLSMIRPYSKEWDELLNSLIEKHYFKEIDEIEATIDGVRVWIANHPHGSFTVLDRALDRIVRPSRRTIYKAHKKLLKDASTVYDDPKKRFTRAKHPGL